MTKTNEYWIWKSEKGKNTCEKCKSLDGKIFYFEDEIPEKPHPNCKCEVVKVVSEEKYEKCDCKELLNKVQNAVENIIAETKTYLGTIQEINTDCEINKESLRDLLNKAYVIKDEYENELAKHLKTCANNKDEEYKEITQKIIDFEKLKKENETNSAKIYELNKNFQNFDKETRVHLVDIQQLKDYSADTPHKKDECKILEDVLDLQTKTKLVNSQFQDYKKQMAAVNLKNENIRKAVVLQLRFIENKKSKTKTICFCTLKKELGELLTKDENNKTTRIKTYNVNKKAGSNAHSLRETNNNAYFSKETLKKASDFIASHEGCALEAYKDTGGKWTIGYGHTKNVKPGDKITKEEAKKFLREDFDSHSYVLKEIKIPLTENQKIAIASFVYNIGVSAFKNSGVFRELNNGNIDKAIQILAQYTKDDKKVEQPGLVRRRNEEIKLFYTPD